MLVNAQDASIARTHGLMVRLVTMPWEDILPAVASAGRTVDVGFGSLIEYLTKYAKLNQPGSDAIVFLQPLYVYKGGGFVALEPSIGGLTPDALNDREAVRAFLRYALARSGRASTK